MRKAQDLAPETERATGERRPYPLMSGSGLLLLLLALGGLAVLTRGVVLVTQIAYNNAAEAREGRNLIALALVLLLATGFFLYRRGRRLHAALVSIPAALCALFTLPFPDSNTYFPFLSLIILGPVALGAAIHQAFWPLTRRQRNRQRSGQNPP